MMKIFKNIDTSLLPSERNFGLSFVFAAFGYFFWDIQIMQPFGRGGLSYNVFSRHSFPKDTTWT